MSTYAFSPSIGELVLYSYGMIGVRRTAILQEHMADAHMAVNLMFGEWANRGVNLWEVKLQSTALVQGTATYTVPANSAMILDAYIETSGSGGSSGSGSDFSSDFGSDFGPPSGSSTSANPIDRVITPISRTEYSAQPNKQLQAAPTLYWYDRTIAPTITLWPVPDGNGPYTLFYYYVSQVGDANYAGGQAPDIPYLWLRALASGLSAELSPIYAPDRETARRADAERSFQLAADWNVENVGVYLSPGLSSYFR